MSVACDQPTVVAILHAPAVKARDQHVRNLCTSFTSCGATVVVVTGAEPPVDDPTSLATLVNMDPNKLGDPNITAVFRPFIREMKIRQLSNALKHTAAIQHIASLAHPDESWHLILEDDAMIDDADALMRACAHAPPDADILFFGLPSALPHPSEGMIRYDEMTGIKLLPSCDAYALRMHTAKFLATSILPIRFPTQIHLSWLISKTGVKTYLTSPNLSVDGSKVGKFVSVIESNNILCFNSEYMTLSHSVPGELDMDEFRSRVKAMPFGEHPDAQVLLGSRLSQAGRFLDAKSVFAAALEVYTSEGAVIGTESTFMRVYMDLFKHCQ